jgi:hypothetical protein
MVARVSIFLLALCGSSLILTAQTPAGAGNLQRSPAPSSANAALPSATLQPSMQILKQALAEIRIDRWKASAAIKSEAQSNLESVQRDLQSTLPPIVTSADAAPGSPAKMLPVYRNVDALYDVMLRLVAAGRIAAPPDQMSALDQTLASLSDARHTLGDQVQQNTDAQEVRVIHLEAALKAIPPPAPPPPPPAPVKCPTTPVKKKKLVPAAKPAASSQTPPAPSN